MVVIKTEKLRKEYGTLAAVNDIDIQIQAGSVIGLIGPNGAGKTTLLRMLATLMLPTSGKIEVLGNDSRSDYHQIRRVTAFLPDFFNLYKDLTLVECLSFFARSYEVPACDIDQKVKESLLKVGLLDKSTSRCKNLSRGMVQRLGMAVLLIRDPEIYLLDEPASGLDPAARIQLKNLIKEIAGRGKTVIISSHILTELADFCTEVVIMDKGRIVQSGTVSEIRSRISANSNIIISLLDSKSQEAATLINNTDLNISANTIGLDKVQFAISGGDDEIAEVNSLLVSNSFRVCGIAKEEIDLEDIFMKVSAGECGL